MKMKKEKEKMHMWSGPILVKCKQSTEKEWKHEREKKKRNYGRIQTLAVYH